MKNNKIALYKAITKCRKSLFPVIFTIICTTINAQGTDSFLDRAPDFLNITSPNAASFTKFIDNPVNLYHGTPDVSIPIYTLKDGDIELPITLRYNTSGIKVQEQASWVGLGWNLNVGGVIVQNIVGDYDGNDEYYDELLPLLNIPNSFSGYHAPTNYAAWHEDFMSKSYTQSQAGKLNPDVFSFSYPGGSGRFVFDYMTDSIFILNRTNAIKIEVTNGNGSVPSMIAIKGFKITTSDGTSHLFRYESQMKSIYQETSGINKPGNPLSISYVLYQSVYPNGQTVNYSYSSYDDYEINYSQKFIHVYTSGDGLGGSRTYNNEDFVHGSDFYLTSISTTNYIVNFNTINRDDVYNGKALQSASIALRSQPNVKLKEFWFDYSYFQASANTKGWQPEGSLPAPYTWNWQESYDYKRLKLLNIYEKKETQTDNKYEFEYDETYLMPAKSSFALDYWGYYNGQINNSSYLPDLRQPLNLTYSDYSNRGYNFNYCKTGILKKIIYPTKGYREFTYEPNTFTNVTGLPTVAQTVSYSGSDYNNPTGNSVSVPFTVPNNCTAELEIVMERGFNSWIDMQDSRVTLQKTSNIIADHHFTYDYHIGHYANHLPNEGQMKIEQTLSLTSGTYNLNINLTNSLPNQFGASTNHGCLRAKITMPYVGTVSQENSGCGLRIKSIVANDLTKTETTEFEYENGILQDILSYSKIVDDTHLRYFIFNAACFDLEGNLMLHCLNHRDERNKKVLEITSFNYAFNPYAINGGVGYGNVKVIQKSSSENNGATVYEFANTPPTFANNSVRVDHPMNSKLLNIKTYNKEDNNVPVKTETNQYIKTTTKKLFGLSYRYLYNTYASVFNNSNLMFNPELYEVLPKYGGPPIVKLLAHPLDIVEYTFDSKTVVEDGITATETYTYNNALQLTSKKVSKSGGNNLEYKYTYPGDYSFAPYNAMNTAHILSPVIEEKIYNNNLYIGGSLTKYKTHTYNNKTLYVRDKKYFSAVATPVSSPPATFTSTGENTTFYPKANIKYENQTAYGKPQSITYNDAERVVYLWGYNYQHPIAEIKNATYADVTAKINAGTLNSIAARTTPTASDFTAINNLRTQLPDAHVTTYTYMPLFGISSVTDPGSKTVTYEYDAFGRLMRIKDLNGKTLEENEYHYRN